MENRTTNDINELPVWVVQGTNWICNVPLDAYNAQFSSIRQAEESATRAVEQFQGQDKNLVLTMEAGNSVPELGGAILVYPLGTDPKDGFLLFVYEMLGNAGYYPLSKILQKQTEEVMAQNLKEAEAEEAKMLALAEKEVKDFNLKEVKKPKKKTARKPANKKAPKKPIKKPAKKPKKSS